MCSKLSTIYRRNVCPYTCHVHTVHTGVQYQIDYWATLNSKQDLSAPSMLLWVRLVGENNWPTQTAGSTGDRLDGGSYGYTRVLIK